MSPGPKKFRIFPGGGHSRSGERGNMVYVLMGALATSGGLALIADRNLRSANEQAFEGASELARESNVSALNMLKVLLAMPVANPSARNPQHVPALFPDTYVNTASPNSVKIGSINNNLPATATGIWRVNNTATVPQIQISSPDLRFTAGSSGASGVFSAAHYSAAPAGPGSVQTKITSVSPVYSGALISAYDVSVDSTVAISARDPRKGSRTVTTKARIAVDRPPDPECDMGVSSPGPMVPGTQVAASFKTYGVVFSARTQEPQTNGNVAWTGTVLPQTAKSIRSTLDGGTAVRAWNVAAKSTEPYNSREGLMRLKGEVIGPALGVKSCEATVRVYIPPTCSITASPAQVPDNGSTTLSVRASGAVDSMTLLGRTYTGAAALSQNVSWSPAGSGSMSATATVRGPSGLTGSCSVSITKDPPRCPLASGNKIRTPVGMVVPSFDNNYHQVSSDWVTRGGSCSNRYFENNQWKTITFNDRTCVPCARSDLCGRYNPNSAATADGATFWRITNYYSGDNCKFELGFIRSAGKGCFDAATELTLADGSRKAISQLKQSDVLWNPVTGQPRKIKKIIRGPEKKPMVELVVGDNKLVVTEDHPFQTGFGYFTASRIRAGDVIVSSGGRRITVTAARRVPVVPGPLDIYRLAVPDSALPVVWNVELENISTNPDDYMVEANGVAAGDLWLQERLKNPKQDRGS